MELDFGVKLGRNRGDFDKIALKIELLLGLEFPGILGL